MIDWITAVVPFVHMDRIFGGAVAGFDDAGRIKWKRESFRQLEGSFEATSVCQTHFRTNRDYAYAMAARDQARQRQEARAVTDDFGSVFTVSDQRPWESTLVVEPFREVWISGNPAKFLQGHNLFGTENLPALAPLYFRAVLEAAGHVVDEVSFRRWLDGDYELARVDVAYMLDVGGPAEVRDCLAALAHQATYAKRGRGVLQAGTVSWGKRDSRQTVVKAYDKHGEITGAKSHQLPEGLPHRGDLYGFSIGKLRVEVELHARHLEKLNLRDGRQWHADTAGTQWSDAMARLNLSGQMPMTPEVLKNLPRKLKKTYMMWESGRDLRSEEYMSGATFRRHRNELLGYDIDIAQPYNAEHKPRVISLQQVLRPVPARTPAWAYGTPLLAAA